MNKENNVSIRVSGEENRVIRTLDLIEKTFPLSLRSKIIANDQKDGTVHGWLTVALLEDSPK